MSSWARCPTAVLVGVVEGAERRGGEWAEHEVLADMVLWQDRCTHPSRPEQLPALDELAVRWGWRTAGGAPAVKRVRRILAMESVWLDPRNAAAWRAMLARRRGVAGGLARHRDEGQREVSGGAAPGQQEGSAPTVDASESTTDGQHEGSAGAATGQREGDRARISRPDPPSTLHPDPPHPPPPRGGVLDLHPPGTAGPRLPEPAAWVRRWRRKPPPGVDPPPERITDEELQAVVDAALDAVRRRPRVPLRTLEEPLGDGYGRCWGASRARPVLALWAELGWCRPADALRVMRLLAVAARHSDHAFFRNDIRGRRADGRAWKADTSTLPASVYRLAPPEGSAGASWADRLDVAEQEFAEGRYPLRGEGPASASAPLQARRAEVGELAGDAWSRVRRGLADLIGEDLEAVWLDGARALGWRGGGRLVVAVPRHVRDWVLDQWDAELDLVARDVLGRDGAVELEVEAGAAPGLVVVPGVRPGQNADAPAIARGGP